MIVYSSVNGAGLLIKLIHIQANGMPQITATQFLRIFIVIPEAMIFIEPFRVLWLCYETFMIYPNLDLLFHINITIK